MKEHNVVPVFNSELHTYTDPTDDFKYTSVTRWVDRFKPIFDKQTRAAKLAAKEGVSVDFILNDWQQKRENSAKYGTKLHKALETFNNTGSIEDTDCIPVVESFKKLKLNFPGQTFHEKLVYNRQLGIAGMADIISHNEDSKTFNVFDFKTNKKFRFQTRFTDCQLLAPLEHYPNTEYYHYALQLSMYGFLYKQMSGLDVKRLKIYWYERKDPENYENFEGQWKIFNLPYLEEDILCCLNNEAV